MNVTVEALRVSALASGCVVLAGCAALNRPDPVTLATPLAASRCTTLTAASFPGVRITEAVWVPAGTERVREGNTPVGEPLPEHCIVRGRIDERTGSDGNPYHTGFELRLPATWSGRMLYQGGGGNDGIVFPAYGRNTGARGTIDNGLQRGYAAVSTDAGHQSPAPLFGLDPQARTEHAWRAHERTATTARALIEVYYGEGPERSYFIGCSGGGRQGMMFSQRFPDYFDGIVAVAPAMRVAEGASIAAAWTTQRLLEAAPRGPDGQPILSQALSDADLKLVAGQVLEACDSLDGLKDGLVQDVAACRFDPAALRCAGAKTDSCLSTPQADALRAVMAGPRNQAGQALYFHWPWDPGIAGSDWRRWTLGTATSGAPDSRHNTLISGALGHEFATPPDPALTVLNFNFESDPARLKAFAAVYNTGDDVELAGFRRSRGKLLMIHGVADPIFSVAESVDYMRRLQARHGGTGDFARLFLVPGMNHCTGGPATDAFDGLAAIERWVEQGQAPARIEAQGTRELPGISRPLCPWPKVARYGQGDPQAAASFECR